MNIDTGKIEMLTDQQIRQHDLMKNMVLITEDELTRKQDRERQVSLHDHRSVLGRKLTEARRSKYVPHMGAKEQAKQQAKPCQSAKTAE